MCTGQWPVAQIARARYRDREGYRVLLHSPYVPLSDFSAQGNLGRSLGSLPCIEHGALARGIEQRGVLCHAAGERHRGHGRAAVCVAVDLGRGGVVRTKC